MPPFRRYKKQGVTRRFVRKAQWTARTKTDKYQNVALSKLAKQVKALTKKPELKNYGSTSTQQVSMSGIVYEDLTKSVTTGTTDNYRIGDEVNSKSIHLKIKYYLTANYTGPVCIRTILFIYKGIWAQSDPSAQIANGNLLTNNTVVSFYNREICKDLFTILYDHTMVMDYNSTPEAKVVAIHRNLMNKAKWDSGIAQNYPTVGHIGLYILTDQSDPIGIQLESLYYFTDD